MLLPLEQRQSRTFRGLSRILRGASELPSSRICRVDVGSKSDEWRHRIVFNRENMNNDDRWPLPGCVSTPNAEWLIANSIYAAVLLHKSLDTRDNTQLLSSFLWGLKQPWQGTRTTELDETWQQCPKVLSLAQVTFSLNSQSLFSKTSCDDCVLRSGFEMAACVDGFSEVSWFYASPQGTRDEDFDAKEVVWLQNRLESSLTGRRCHDSEWMPTRHR